MRIVKIGGSLLARKGAEPRFRRRALSRILGEMAKSPPDILIHGAGAYGHNPASLAKDPEDLPPELVPRIRASVARLRGRVSAEIALTDLSFCPLSPEEMFVMDKGGHPLSGMALGLISRRLPAMTWGDIAYQNGKFRIYSGDEAACDLARGIPGRHRFIFVTDVPGILDPRTGEAFREFSQDMLPLLVGESMTASLRGARRRPDVTGGMAGKALRALEIARAGHEVAIIGDGRGELESAMKGGRVGTTIRAGVK